MDASFQFWANELTGDNMHDDYLFSAGAVGVHISTMNLMVHRLLLHHRALLVSEGTQPFTHQRLRQTRSV